MREASQLVCGRQEPAGFDLADVAQGDMRDDMQVRLTPSAGSASRAEFFSD